MWNLICSVFLFSPNVIPHWGLAPNVGSHWLHVANMESNIFRFFFQRQCGITLGACPQCDITLLLFVSFHVPA